MKRLISLSGVSGVLLNAATTTAATLPPSFQESTVFAGLVQPTAVKFASDGRVFVAEKSGLVKVFPSLADTTPTIFADLRTNVHNYWDRGLLGLELHPDFPATPYVYVLYTLDRKPGGPIPTWGTPGATSDGCPTPPGPTSKGCPVTARLSRLQAAGNVTSGTEQVLIEDWCQQFPSHSIGGLAFGPDGALYVSGGDGASFNNVDYGQYGGTRRARGTPLNVCGDPPVAVGGTQTPPTAEGGALRSQSLGRPSGEPVVLGGAILRLDASTGQAMPDNPLASHVDVNARRIIAYGFRNPFRFALRPGTNEIWVGDVGWNTWEEVDRFDRTVGGVPNFGWPCYEGDARQEGYAAADLDQCERLYSTNGAVDGPYFTYNHAATVVPEETCPIGSSAVAGLAFYGSGSYPAAYDGALFFTDYSRRCIWAMMPDASGTPNPGGIVTFAAGLSGGAVNLQIGPGGDLFYVDFDGGRIQRVRYFPTNQPPTAVASADRTSGAAPLTVHFDGSGSRDPEGDTLVYTWDLDGDGAYDDSTAVAPIHTFADPGTYTARLRVSDPDGATATTSLSISVNNTPPTAIVTTPLASLTWRVGDTIAFSGSGSDPQQGTLPPSALTWTILLQHCPSTCHVHTLESFTGVASGSFSAPDHDYPSYLQVRLTVKDAGGLANSTTVAIQPKTVALTFASSPPGMRLGVDAVSAAAPFTRTVIVGSSNSVSAPAPQTLAGDSYAFSSWSDGGAQTHTILAPAIATTYTARYATTSSADLAVTQWAAPNPVTARAPLTYTIAVTNRGPATQTDVTVRDTLPASAAFVSSAPNSPTCALVGGTVACSLGSMAPAATRSVSIVVRPHVAGTLTSTAIVSGGRPDPDGANDAATTSTTVKPRPTIAIDDVSVVEGDRGTVDAVFTVSLSLASTQTVTVRYASSDGTAHAGHDYTAVAGTLRFTPGVVTRPIAVPVYGERRKEANETFYLKLSVPVNATIADRQGLGTIVGDDGH